MSAISGATYTISFWHEANIDVAARTAPVTQLRHFLSESPYLLHKLTLRILQASILLKSTVKISVISLY